jgi:hypothetical protein
MALPVRSRTAAAVAATALVAAVVPGAAAQAAPMGGVPAGAATPAASEPSPSVPSRGDVADAQDAAATVAKGVARITAKVKAATGRLETLQRGMARAVAADEAARTQLADADAAVEQALADLAAARAARDQADSELSATAGEMYMQGGDLQSLTTLVFSPPNTMSDLRVVIDQSAHEVSADLDAATSAAAKATASQRVLSSVRSTRDALASQAAAKRASVEKETARAGAEAAELGKEQEALSKRLDELNRTADDLVGQREAAARLSRGEMLGLQAPAGAPRAAQEIARTMMPSRGWDGGEFTCLVALWNAESGWSWSAENPSSGAYGIPQALPGWKMSSAGSDWLTNPATQIEWGMGYIDSTYGSPCNAYNAFLGRSPHWY